MRALQNDQSDAGYARGVPTLVLIKNGQVADTVVGLASQGALKEKLDTLTEAN